MLADRREAWDSGTYWSMAYPLALLVCAGLGYRYRLKPWRWAAALFLAQFIAMCVRNGELGNLWPLGIVMFMILALPGMAAAQLAARLGSARRDPGRTKEKA